MFHVKHPRPESARARPRAPFQVTAGGCMLAPMPQLFWVVFALFLGALVGLHLSAAVLRAGTTKLDDALSSLESALAERKAALRVREEAQAVWDAAVEAREAALQAREEAQAMLNAAVEAREAAFEAGNETQDKLAAAVSMYDKALALLKADTQTSAGASGV